MPAPKTSRDTRLGSSGLASGVRDAASILMGAARSLGSLMGVVESSGGGGAASGAQKEWVPARRFPCPFYKKMPGTPFVVDAFCYAGMESVRHYVLTHFHSDHYGGLTKDFDSGVIYCSTITAALVHMRLGVKYKFLRPLPMHKPVVIEGVQITLLDANHCPGAAMFLFRLRSGVSYLHVGDFRWSDHMKSFEHLRGYAAGANGPERISSLYLDTTYIDPKYDFPSQAAALLAVRQAVASYASDKRTLFLFGTYSIGKERVFMEAARYLDERVYVDKGKYRTLSCLEWSLEDMARLTTDPEQSRLHVTGMWALSFKRMEDILSKAKGRYSRIVAFKPTGWTFGGGAGLGPQERGASIPAMDPRELSRPVLDAPGAEDLGTTGIRRAAGPIRAAPLYKRTGGRAGRFTVFGVPYSEHSSFGELRACVQWLDPVKIIPTVNCKSSAHAREMEALLRQPTV